ncbi:MAG TPA: hypothetical protein VHD83_02490 [Puia sp.]|nr:hypothetical protein [Puia sp.]
MDFLNGKTFGRWLSRVTAFIILLPFFLISFFNHPLGDDYWATDLARRLGFWRAQVELYNTVPPRWLDLGISCLGPLTWGNFWGYKVIPVVFILLIIAAVAELFRTLSKDGDSAGDGDNAGATRKDCYGLAILFTAVFLSAAPGIGGGIYWVAAVNVFGVGLLLFICWVNLLLIWYRGTRSRWVLAGIGVCFLGMAGSNEIITVVSLVVLGAVNVYRIGRKRGIDRATVLVLILWGLSAGFVACFKGVSNRYILMQTADSGKLWYSAGFSILVSGFCIFKALTSPFCLAALIVAYEPFVRWGRKMYGRQQELLNAVSYFTAAWLFILFIIPFIVLYLSGLHPPYRVVNYVLFFQLAGLMYFGALAVNGALGKTFAARMIDQTRMARGRAALARLGRYRNMAVAALLIMGFMWKNNVSTAARELVSGSAYQYDREMNQRYQLILQCKADSCVVPRLRHTSITLRYDSADLDDPHLNDYFQKEVIVR